MNTSDDGIDLIKRSEGFRATVYNDSAGHPTIGYGHMLKSGENLTAISQDDAEVLLRADILAAEHAINSLVTVNLNQGQFDALADFAFNLGIGTFAGSTMRRALNAGKYDAAAAEFGKWVFAGGVRQQGLVTRRAAEKAMFTGTA